MVKRVIEADASSAIHLEGDSLGVRPHSRFELEQDGQTLILRPIENGAGDQRPLWERLSPQERAEEFLDWVRRQPPSDVHLTDEQLRRENIYD